MQDATHHRVAGIDDDHGAEWVLWRRGIWTAARSLAEALRAPTAPDSEAIHVWGDHGRWIVKCPDCNGAQLAAPNDHRFMCNECANIAIDGLWRPVIWPPNPHQLGAILDERAASNTRNYDPGETAAELREQNDYLAAGGALVISGGARYVPGADTDEEVDGAASDFEGHTHTWPKHIRGDKVYTCRGCDLEVDGLTLLIDREQQEQAKMEKGAR